MDISPKAIDYARELVLSEGLSDKHSRLLLSETKDLQFREYSGEVFDYILAQSVFTHLKAEHIEECFENIGRIMDHRSAFYFTYFQGRSPRQIGLKGFCYPLSFFHSLARKHGFELTTCSDDYPHPRNQHMVELRATDRRR